MLFRVAGGVTAPQQVRQEVRRQLGEALNERTMGDLELLLSEVVTNAVRYATSERASEIEVRVDVDAETLSVEVVDQGAGFARPASPKPRFEREPGGFGLFMLDRLSVHWGVERTDTGVRVWFRLPLAAV